MIIYHRKRDHQLPLCKRCKGTLRQAGLRDKKGNFWHPDCYEQHVQALLKATEESLNIIIAHTQDHNSAALGVAYRALERITK